MTLFFYSLGDYYLVMNAVIAGALFQCLARYALCVLII